jgi:hypothetical protein
MRTRLVFPLATAGAFLLVTLWWTRPLLPAFRTAYLAPVKDPTLLGRSDSMLTSWMLAWGAHALRTNPFSLFHANIFHPLPWTFAFSENLLAGTLLVLPIDFAVGDPVLDHNVLLIASFVLAGLGTALLVRELGGGVAGACLAGVIVAFNPFRFESLNHVQVLSSHWMPFALLALHRCWRTGRGAGLVALTVVLVAWSSIYYAYFFWLALAVLVPLHWLLGCPTAPRGRARALAGLAVAAAGTALILVPYGIARDVYALTRDMGEAFFFGGKGIMYLGALADPIGYVTRRYLRHESVPVVLGLATLPLMALGVRAGFARAHGGRRGALCYLAVAVVMALVSLGPLLQWATLLSPSVPGPWLLLSAVVPGFSALRVPARAATVVVLAAAVLAGLGADALWRAARAPVARAAVAALLVLAAVAEGWRPPLELNVVPWAARGAPPVYDWLAAQPGRDAILELPFGLPASDSSDMVMSARHWRPLLNGYSGFAPTVAYLGGVFFAFPSPTALRLLAELGVRWVVLHTADLRPGMASLCNATALPRELRRAYHDEGDCVLEVRGAPPAPPAPRDRPIVLGDASVTSSSGEDASAVIDGRLETHWVQRVDQKTEGWLQLDLPAPQALSRIVVQLGAHYGEYLRQWRVDTSADGVAWTRIAGLDDASAPPPLAQMLHDPAHLTTDLPLPPGTVAQHLRIVRTGADEKTPWNLWPNWSQWGVHELTLFAPTT